MSCRTRAEVLRLVEYVMTPARRRWDDMVEVRDHAMMKCENTKIVTCDSDVKVWEVV